jgi:hypothetical protein
MTDTNEPFGFNQNDAGVGGRAQKFKGDKGRTYRIGFVWWPGMEDDQEFTYQSLVPKEGGATLTPLFVRAPRNFIPGVGYVINNGPEWTRLAGQAPKMMIATIIVSWPLGEDGTPTKESLFSRKPDVMPWIFSGDKYEKLKKMHVSGYPMYDWDVQLDCEDSQFQKFGFLPAKQCIFKEMLKAQNPAGQDIVRHIVARVQMLAPTLAGDIGQDLTIDQLREKMGQDVAGPVDRAVAGDQEVDSMLGSLLDE